MKRPILRVTGSRKRKDHERAPCVVTQKDRPTAAQISELRAAIFWRFASADQCVSENFSHRQPRQRGTHRGANKRDAVDREYRRNGKHNKTGANLVQ